MGATANDSTIGLGVFLLLLLFCCCICGFFWHRCVFLVFSVFSVCFLGVGAFFVTCGGMWLVAKYPEMHQVLYSPK